jgi:hypothetical protein
LAWFSRAIHVLACSRSRQVGLALTSPCSIILTEKIFGLKPYNSISFILGTLDWLGSAEPSMSWLVVEVGK